jgi:hypothetical protein
MEGGIGVTARRRSNRPSVATVPSNPVPMTSERGLILVLTRFLHANRYPLRSKTL